MDDSNSQGSDDPVVILDSDPDEVTSRIQFLTIGCVISDQIVNITTVLMQLRRSWAPLEVLAIRLLRGNVYSINFANKRAIDTTVDHSPLVASKCCSTGRKCHEGVSIDEIYFSKIADLDLDSLNPYRSDVGS